MNKFTLGPLLLLCTVPLLPQTAAIPSTGDKNDDAIVQAYAAKYPQCLAANNQQKLEDALHLCSDLDDIAGRFTNEAKWNNAIREAYLQYGQALANNHDLPNAIKIFRAAVSLADKYLKPEAVEYATAYYWQAWAEHANGDQTQADTDYKTAETSFRKAIAVAPDSKPKYDKYLARTLAFHGVLLEQTGRRDEAARLKAEATTLDPAVLDGMQKKE
jgi:tetratricopeptide (TPR) repeat protein